ncbi:hypothetical protein Q73A0000_08905 [Kaistella flava (ex Peng et al. 2021)]|uniref:Uncharacterized protein n=1 Tax=Kaistella flava (ex Peng et al. 2021) TaxID=2038776 RepID=A0A7M2YA02_9FLAO|nr:hypothetical protein [Kaistella flava (ex Peng et al. 2021)]QOW10475.1 hypothetical protein Q73A0000_08905 [Kaistella flava (ex Peng et al. 2021)]
MQNIFAESKNKTRVLVLSSQPSVMKLLLDVLNFHAKDFDFYLANGVFNNSNSDFVILETSDLEKAASFEPNIVLITSEISGEQIVPVIEKITPGGVLVYDSNIADIVEQSLNFFRKLEYSGTAFSKSNSNFALQTNIGEIPISSSDENLIKNIDGLKLLSQQFGVMEEDFYEPVMSFE